MGAQRILLLGSGATGSTLLEMNLALSSEVTALGEVSEFARILPHKHVCTCGALFASCPLWGGLLAEAGRAGWSGTAFLARAIDRAWEIEPTRWCVVSVKNERALANERQLGLARTRAIYLVRHPCGYVYSWLTNGFDFERLIGAWIHEQEQTLAFLDEAATEGVASVTVRYEDFVGDPGRTLGRLGEFLGATGPFGERNAAWNWEKAPWGRRQHVLCGAPWRLSGRPEAIREDVRWKLALSPSAQAKVLRACRPLMRRLGYAEGN